MASNLLRSIVFLGIAFVASAAAANGQERCSGDRIFNAPDCSGDSVSDEENALLTAVNAYRATNGLPAVKASVPLSRVANRRMLDLTQNLKVLTHSWSNCRYDIASQSTWGCMLDSPVRLRSGFNGKAYETLFHGTSGRVGASRALDMWSKSDLHRAILLNQGAFARMKWREAGVAIEGGYASLWFGYMEGTSSDLGANLSSTLRGLDHIKPVGTKPAASMWAGSSADGSTRLDINGNEDAVTQIVMTLSKRGGGPADLAPAVQLLRNVFPTWTDSETWLRGVAGSISTNASVWRTKVLDGAALDVRSEGGVLRLTIRPNARKVGPTEIR